MATLFPNQPLKGLLPSVDPKQVQQPYCISGKNFMLDAKSVYTAFGSSVANMVPVDDPKGVKIFQLANSSTVAVCTSSGIYLLDEANQPFQTLWQPAGISRPSNWPWTYAYVGGAHYFCRRGYPVVYYNNNIPAVAEVDDANLPDNPSFITEVNGRLVVLGDNFYCWSEFAEGRNFEASTQLKVGAQFLSLIGGGEPRALFPVLGGFFVATTRGVIKATYIDTDVLLQHDVVEGASMAPVDPNAWASLDDQQAIVVSQAGTFKYTSQKIEIWEPIMSEYIQRSITPTYREAATGTIMVSYLDNLKYLFVSLSTTSVEGVYVDAFVFDFFRGEWGSFNQLHTSVGPVPVFSSELYKWEYGYVDADGVIHKFIMLPQRELAVSSGDVYIPVKQQPPIWVGDAMAFSSSMLMTYYSTDGLPSRAGIYTVVSEDLVVGVVADPPVGQSNLPVPDEDWQLMDAAFSEDWNLLSGAEDWNAATDGYFNSSFGMAVGLSQRAAKLASKTFGNLVSNVTVGSYRLTDEQYPNRTSYVTNVAIAMESPIGVLEHEDWNTDAPAEDWNMLTGAEDWGEMAIAASDYVPTIQSTIDGFEVFNPDEEKLTTVTVSGESIFYSGYSTGIWHNIHISADSENEAFRMKHIEVTGNMGGLL